MLGKMRSSFSEGPYFSLLTLRSACFFQSMYLSPMTINRAWPASWGRDGCTVWSFIFLCKSWLLCPISELHDWAIWAWSDNILHLLSNPFPEKCYNTIEILTSICSNHSFCCNFQCWFPDISAAIYSPRENFPVTVLSVPHPGLQPYRATVLLLPELFKESESLWKISERSSNSLQSNIWLCLNA